MRNAFRDVFLAAALAAAFCVPGCDGDNADSDTDVNVGADSSADGGAGGVGGEGGLGGLGGESNGTFNGDANSDASSNSGSDSTSSSGSDSTSGSTSDSSGSSSDSSSDSTSGSTSDSSGSSSDASSDASNENTNTNENTNVNAAQFPVPGEPCPPQPLGQCLAAGTRVALPVLNFQGRDDVCRSVIQVQNVGSRPTKAILVVWGEPGFCAPQAAGPLKTECSGLIPPGSAWTFAGPQVPTGAASGVIYSFSADLLSERGLDANLGFDDVIADLMCEELFFGVVGDADDYRRFDLAYRSGGDFRGIPMDQARGEPLAVVVYRACPGDVTPGVEVTSTYEGISDEMQAAPAGVSGAFEYYVPLVYADKAGFNTVMYIQNEGFECTSVELWFQAQDDCLRARICDILTLAPGETHPFHATDCVGPDWQGNVLLRSTEPLGIAVDISGRDVLMTSRGIPADPATGGTTLCGPLTYSEEQGWDVGVQVQNLDRAFEAQVQVTFFDRSGDIILPLVDVICPGGTQTFFLPVVSDLPGQHAGWVKVESQSAQASIAFDVPNAPASIAAVVQLIRYSDAARTETIEAAMYNLCPCDLEQGHGNPSFAVPFYVKDLDTDGRTSEVAVTNMSCPPPPQDCDVACFSVFDQNGLVLDHAQCVGSGQVAYHDLQRFGLIPSGFAGSAIVSERDLPFTFGVVGVVRSGTRLGENVPGDELAVYSAFPSCLVGSCGLGQD